MRELTPDEAAALLVPAIISRARGRPDAYSRWASFDTSGAVVRKYFAKAGSWRP